MLTYNLSHENYREVSLVLEKILGVVDVCASKTQLSLELRNNSLHWNLGHGNADFCLVHVQISIMIYPVALCSTECVNQDNTLFKTTIKLNFIESHVSTNNW